MTTTEINQEVNRLQNMLIYKKQYERKLTYKGKSFKIMYSKFAKTDLFQLYEIDDNLDLDYKCSKVSLKDILRFIIESYAYQNPKENYVIRCIDRDVEIDFKSNPRFVTAVFNAISPEGHPVIERVSLHRDDFKLEVLMERIKAGYQKYYF